jgi:phosphatidylglycerophosphate synthase
MDARLLEAQKKRDVLSAFWLRKISPYLTAVLLRTPITPNQTTVLWGLLSITNSYLLYRVLLGNYLLLPVVPLIYIFAELLDCVDGEIARARQMSNPIGGKLLDGVCHRATEYSLLAASASAAADLTGSWWALPVGLLLLSGEAMYTYAYERRLTAMRVNIGFTGLVAKAEDNMYERGERWSDLSVRRKILTIKGQVHYKSIYPIVALSYVSGSALLAGLALYAAYKHFVWMKLVAQTVAVVRDCPETRPVDSSPVVTVRATGT